MAFGLWRFGTAFVDAVPYPLMDGPRERPVNHAHTPLLFMRMFLVPFFGVVVEVIIVPAGLLWRQPATPPRTSGSPACTVPLSLGLSLPSQWRLCVYQCVAVSLCRGTCPPVFAHRYAKGPVRPFTEQALSTLRGASDALRTRSWFVEFRGPPLPSKPKAYYSSPDGRFRVFAISKP